MSLKRIWKPEDKLKVLEKVEKGAKIVEVCRKYQIDPRMYYNWKERYQKEKIEGLKDRMRNLRWEYFYNHLRIHSSIGHKQVLNFEEESESKCVCVKESKLALV